MRQLNLNSIFKTLSYTQDSPCNLLILTGNKELELKAIEPQTLRNINQMLGHFYPSSTTQCLHFEFGLCSVTENELPAILSNGAL